MRHMGAAEEEMNKAVIYLHGKGGNAAEAAHYSLLFPDCDVLGFDYRAETPWDARHEFPEYFDRLSEKYDGLILIANSIGAFLTMSAGIGERIERAYFISPVVDMERLITDMMSWAGVTEAELMEKKEIETFFSETLSWEYLCYVRENPAKWDVPTRILYGEKDHLSALETVSRFAEGIGASLTVMPDGEHWFHTEEQMAFLDEWIKEDHYGKLS